MNIICPHTIGKNSIKCIDGHINGSRCPYYQRRGQIVSTQKLLEVPIVMATDLCHHITDIMRDYSTIGHYTWSCTEWPGISTNIVECSLIDHEGNIHTIQQVIERYKVEQESSEVMIDDGEREEVTTTECPAHIYN